MNVHKLPKQQYACQENVNNAQMEHHCYTKH